MNLTIKKRKYMKLSAKMQAALYHMRVKNKQRWLDMIANALKWVLGLDGTNYAELSEPVTFAGDFDIEVEFSTTYTSFLGLFGYLGGTNSYLQLRDDGTVRFATENGSRDYTPSLSLTDGGKHTIRFVRISDQLTGYADNTSMGTQWRAGDFVCTLVGTLGGGLQYFQGTIYSAKLTDIDTPANSISWNLDSGPPVYDAGSEIVSESNFDVDTSYITTASEPWYKTSDTLCTWDSSGYVKVENSAASASRIIQTVNVVSGQVYLVEVKINDRLGAQGAIKIGSTEYNNSLLSIVSLGVGTHTAFFTADYTGVAYIVLPANDTTIGDYVVYDSISVKPYISTISSGTVYQESEEYGTEADIMRADDWSTPPTGVTVSGRTATFDGTQTLWSTANINLGELFVGFHEITYRVYSATQGLVKINDTEDAAQPNVYNGVYTITINPSTGGSIRVMDVGSEPSRFIGSVEVISVREIPQGLIYQNVAPEDWTQE